MKKYISNIVLTIRKTCEYNSEPTLYAEVLSHSECEW